MGDHLGDHLPVGDDLSQGDHLADDLPVGDDLSQGDHLGDCLPAGDDLSQGDHLGDGVPAGDDLPPQTLDDPMAGTIDLTPTDAAETDELEVDGPSSTKARARTPLELTVKMLRLKHTPTEPSVGFFKHLSKKAKIPYDMTLLGYRVRVAQRNTGSRYWFVQKIGADGRGQEVIRSWEILGRQIPQ